MGGQGHTGLDMPVGDLLAVRDELVIQKSAAKLAATDDEGSTSALPERVLFWPFCPRPLFLKLIDFINIYVWPFSFICKRKEYVHTGDFNVWLFPIYQDE